MVPILKNYGLMDLKRRLAMKQPKWKRIEDVVMSLIFIVSLSWVFALIVVWIKLVSPGPVIFKQKRIGLNGREFTFYKFRTMTWEGSSTPAYHKQHESHMVSCIHDRSKPMLKLDSKDNRIIPGGRFLRIFLDELPQLFNVLMGNMSFVGPRPGIPYEVNDYRDDRRAMMRYNVLPGITGLWQVSGKNRLTFDEMIDLDLKYEERCSLWFDLWIILRTVPTVIGLALEKVSEKLKSRRPVMETEPFQGLEAMVGESVTNTVEIRRIEDFGLQGDTITKEVV
jgi:lipopolysaccharide/colanic/teichoic acid biosynthesis glycosyltransferase